MSNINEKINILNSIPQLIKELKNEIINKSSKDITSLESAKDYLTLLNRYRNIEVENDAAFKGETFKEWLNEVLSVGESGIYSDSIRFLFELIQNVDDCTYSKNDCNLSIKFEKKDDYETIVLEYNEDGFTPENVYAITGIAESSKINTPDEVKIGEKGIGFKSVFGIAEKVWIQSGFYSFELKRDSITVPILKYDGYRPVNGTKMILFLEPNRSNVIQEKLRSDYIKPDALLNKNPVLFLNKINRLELLFDNNNSIIFEITNKKRKYNGYSPREFITLSYSENNKLKKAIKCLKYVLPIDYSIEDYKTRFRKVPKGNKKYYAFCVLPYPNYINDIENGSLYSFLPTQTILNIPVAIHAPFKLNVSREYVDPQNKNAWFVKTCEAVGELLQRMFLDFARVVKGSIIQYLPTIIDNSIFKQTNDKISCLSENTEFLSERFLDLPLYYTNNKLLYNTDVVSINPEEVKNANYENEIRLIYKLLGEKKPLFIGPKDSKLDDLENINIKVISNINKLIFEQAFYNRDITKEALKYLSDKNVCFKSSDIESLNKFELDVSQLKEFIYYKEYLDLLKKYSEKTLKNLNLPKLNLSQCLELENAIDINDKYYEELDIDSAKIEIINYLKAVKRILILKSKEPNKSFYICLKNVLILSEDYKSSFAELRKAFNDKDFYSAMISMEKKSDEIYNYENNPNITLLEFLKELSQLRRATKKILGLENYKKYTDIILESGKDSKRFIKELLQNADDCDFPADIKPTFVLEYKQGDESKMIHTICNENGFTKSNIRAITAIGESTKKKILEDNKEKTGEKGVGFKTVFGVAKEVTILSEDISFKLTREEPTIPTKFQNINKINGSEMEFLLEDDYKLFYLTEKEVLQLCVCLHNLKEISINNFKVTISDYELERQIKINDKTYTLIKNIYSFKVNDDTILAERSKNGIKKINKNQNIYCYFFKNGNPEGFEFKLYSSLATNITIYNNLIIDAPFELTTSRDEIIHNGWNELIRNYLYNAIKNTLEKHKSIINKNILRYIKINEQCNSSISSDNWLNNIYYLNLFKACKFLPTYADNVFVSPNEKCKLIPPVVKYILDKGETLDLEKDRILNLSVSKDNPIYNAFEFSYIDDNIVLALIEPYINKYIIEEKFRGLLYPYLINLNKIELIPIIRNFNIFPVYSQDGKFDYIKWQDNIYTEKGIYKSEANYLVLNETILSKDDCEKILGNIRIKEMCFDLIKSNYNNMLYNKIIKEMTAERAYYYILDEFNNGNIEKYEAKYTTVKKLFEENKLPLKNVLGEYIVGKPLFIDEENSFPFSNLLQTVTLANEAIELVDYCCLNFKSLFNIYSDDLWLFKNDSEVILTADDVEAFQSDLFEHRNEILRFLVKNKYISEELKERYQLEYFSDDFKSIDYGGNKPEFPNSDDVNFDILHQSYVKRFSNPEKIVTEKVEIPVKKVKYNGKLSDLYSKELKKDAIDRYTVSSGECYCQRCKNIKPKEFIEVNNIEKDPEYFWKEMRIVLCLECSKEFKAFRENDSLRNDFYNNILKMDLKTGNGPVEVQIEDGTITFSRQHIAEIQEILKQQRGKFETED